MAVIRNDDGRLELFARGNDDALIHVWQEAPNSGWSDWQSLGGQILTAPAVGRSAEGRLEVFARDLSAFAAAIVRIRQTAPNNGWSAWDSLGGGLSLRIPVVSHHADGRLVVFALSNDRVVWHNSHTAPDGGSWTGWESMNQKLAGVPAAIPNADGRLELFGQSEQDTMLRTFQSLPNGTWSEWTAVAGNMGHVPAAGRNANGRLEVFSNINGPNGDLASTFQSSAGSGPWTSWAALMMPVGFPPVVARNADGRLELFARGADNALWHTWQTAPNNGWSPWHSRGGRLTSDPLVGLNADGRLEVFARGTDFRIHHLWQEAPNSGWSGWEQLGDAIVREIGSGFFEW